MSDEDDNTKPDTDLAGRFDALVMSKEDFNKLLNRTFLRQRDLAANSNFYIKGFDSHKYATLLQAFAEELGLIRISDS